MSNLPNSPPNMTAFWLFTPDIQIKLAREAPALRYHIRRSKSNLELRMYHDSHWGRNQSASSSYYISFFNVLTVAILGVSCGIPDFRSRDGLYASLKERGEYELDDPQQM